MENFLNQLPAVLGVIVGAAGAFLVATLTNRAQWRRDQAVRWDARRLDTYVTYAASVKEIHTVALRISASYRPSRLQSIDREQGQELLAEANSRRTTAWEAMLLLGDENTVAAARVWREAVRAEEYLCISDSFDIAKWQAAVAAVDQARDHFYLAARESLGVHGGSVAQSPFLHAAARPVPTELATLREPRTD
jgi:hypothetical protein